jgi:GST-like protein
LIELYSWYTSNGRKVSIALEELGLPYEIHPIDITKGEQKELAFLAVSPNGKIPAIVDQDAGGRTLMESGAILLYLADKIGRLISKDEDQRWRTIEWLMWQMGGIGPFLGQHLHFTHYKPDVSDYGKERYANEARRLYGVLDQRLVDHEYLADDYSIADIATWPWIARHNWQRIDLNEYPHVRRWYVAIAERPAVQRGWRVPENDQEIPMPVMGDELKATFWTNVCFWAESGLSFSWFYSILNGRFREKRSFARRWTDRIKYRGFRTRNLDAQSCECSVLVSKAA